MDESVVETVVNQQFRDVIAALRVHTSVEIAGFGKFLMMPKRAEKLLFVLERNMELAKNGASKIAGKPIEAYEKEIDSLKKRLAYVRESEADSGGMDEYAD